MWLAGSLSACGPDTVVTAQEGSGSGTGGINLETGMISASDTGAPFACPGARWHDGNLEIDDSTDLEEVRDIGGVTGYVQISRGDIADLEFLPCLERVGSNLAISRNANLVSLEGLDRLHFVGDPVEGGTGFEGYGSLSIRENSRLPSLKGLAIESVLGVLIGSNPALTDASQPALRRAKYIELGGYCDFYAGDNEKLTSIGEFPSLEYLEGVTIDAQSGFTSLSSVIALVEAGLPIQSAAFRRNVNLPHAEVEAFAAASGVVPVACFNKELKGECQPWCTGE